MLPFILLAFFLAAQDKPPEKFAISGTVVNSVTGEPLNKTQIFAELEGSPTAYTTSDERGRFTLVDLNSGQYRLKGRRNGFLESYYGARLAGGKGTTVALDPGQEWKDLQIKLAPAGAIAGTVRDPDGEPLVQAWVSLLALRYRNGKREATAAAEDVLTDDLGQYRAILGLARSNR